MSYFILTLFLVELFIYSLRVHTSTDVKENSSLLTPAVLCFVHTWVFSVFHYFVAELISFIIVWHSIFVQRFLINGIINGIVVFCILIFGGKQFEE